MLWQPMNLTANCPAGANVTACMPFGYVFLNLVVHLFGNSRDNRIQKRLRKQGKGQRLDCDENYLEFDFIIVGAGSAGCVVANRLSANPNWKVLLIEAGMEQPDVTRVPGLSSTLLGSNIDWGYTTEPDGRTCLARPGGRCSWPRGKVMGGSSSINSMVYVRGNKLDYDNWAALGNDGWSYKDVLPYFKKSERNLNIRSLNPKYHGTCGEQAVSKYATVDRPAKIIIDAYHELGLPPTDINGPSQYGADHVQATASGGVRASAYQSFIQPIRYTRRNLVVEVESEVFEILINKNKVAYGIKYKRHGKIYTAYAKKEVIICAGSINSPKLLMLSGVGPKDHLSKLNIPVKQDLAVGENLQDHATFHGYLIILSNKTSTLVDNDEMLKKVCEYKRMKVKRGPMAYGGFDTSIAFLKSDRSIPAPDIQIHVGGGIANEYISDLVTADSLRIFPIGFYNSIYPRITYLTPKSRGKLKLNSSNPHGAPLIFSAYFEKPIDLIPIIKTMRVYLTLEKTKVFRSVGAYFDRTLMPACKNYSWGSDEYTACLARYYTNSALHPVGTCKMGPRTDEKAVVDPELRVYGISRLRVIDSSIMPCIIRGNTNAPSIMIGERGVAFVLRHWLRRY